MESEEQNSNTEFTLNCPVCEKGILEITSHVHDLPDKDKMLLISFNCNQCGFHKNDIIPLVTNIEPGIKTLRVSNSEDLKSKIYRSPTGKIEIPELELEVEPGPQADFYYTNVEGILDRFRNAVLIYQNQIPADDSEQKSIDQTLSDLDNAITGELQFTLILTDLEGGSYIIPVDETKFRYKKVERK